MKFPNIALLIYEQNQTRTVVQLSAVASRFEPGTSRLRVHGLIHSATTAPLLKKTDNIDSFGVFFVEIIHLTNFYSHFM